MKQELILIKVGEIALKGLNRRTFEDVLMKNIKRHLAPLGKFEVRCAQSTIYVRPLEEGVDLDDACERVGKVFGIAAYSRACMAKKDMDDINRTAAEYLKEALEEASTFKVEAKRSDKAFPLKSPAICAETGGTVSEPVGGRPRAGYYRHRGDPGFWSLCPRRSRARSRRNPGGNRRQGGGFDFRRHRQPGGGLDDG